MIIPYDTPYQSSWIPLFVASIFLYSMYLFPFTINPRGYLEISPADITIAPRTCCTSFSCSVSSPNAKHLRSWIANSCRGASNDGVGGFVPEFSWEISPANWDPFQKYDEMWWNMQKLAFDSEIVKIYQNLVETNLEKNLFGRVYVNLLEGVIGLICRTKKIECFQCSLKHKFCVFNYIGIHIGHKWNMLNSAGHFLFRHRDFTGTSL